MPLQDVTRTVNSVTNTHGNDDPAKQGEPDLSRSTSLLLAALRDDSEENIKQKISQTVLKAALRKSARQAESKSSLGGAAAGLGLSKDGDQGGQDSKTAPRQSLDSSESSRSQLPVANVPPHQGNGAATTSKDALKPETSESSQPSAKAPTPSITTVPAPPTVTAPASAKTDAPTAASANKDVQRANNSVTRPTTSTINKAPSASDTPGATTSKTPTPNATRDSSVHTTSSAPRPFGTSSSNNTENKTKERFAANTKLPQPPAPTTTPPPQTRKRVRFASRLSSARRYSENNPPSMVSQTSTPGTTRVRRATAQISQFMARHHLSASKLLRWVLLVVVWAVVIVNPIWFSEFTQSTKNVITQGKQRISFQSSIPAGVDVIKADLAENAKAHHLEGEVLDGEKAHYLDGEKTHSLQIEKATELVIDDKTAANLAREDDMATAAQDEHATATATNVKAPESVERVADSPSDPSKPTQAAPVPPKQRPTGPFAQLMWPLDGSTVRGKHIPIRIQYGNINPELYKVHKGARACLTLRTPSQQDMIGCVLLNAQQEFADLDIDNIVPGDYQLVITLVSSVKKLTNVEARLRVTNHRDPPSPPQRFESDRKNTGADPVARHSDAVREALQSQKQRQARNGVAKQGAYPPLSAASSCTTVCTTTCDN